MMDKAQSTDDVGKEVNVLLQKKDFGASFRPAREKLGLSQAEVAENLLISIDIIKALENSQADALPALTFTQGYIRSYARLLNVSADEIISDYVLMAPDSKQVLTPHSVLQAQKSSGDLLIKMITVSFVIVSVIVLGYWLYQTNFDMNVPLEKETAGFNLQTEGRVQNEQAVDEIVKKPLLMKEKTEDSQQESNVPESVGTDYSEVEKVEVIVEVKKEVLVADQLLLSALDDSWCEIQDSVNKRLFYQLLSKGQEIALSGVAPFEVFLGNAPKVRVEVNNKIVDFENLIRKNSKVVNLKIEKDATVNLILNR